MGRNRRAAQQEAQAAAPTLESTLQLARLDLHTVLERLPELWEHIYAPDVRHLAKPADDKDAPAEAKRRVQQPGYAQWTGPAKLQRVYQDVVAELARAHWVLGQDTDVPQFWTILAVAPTLTGERAPTVEMPEAVKWTRVLDRSLEWLQAQDTEDFRPPEVNASMEAAGHIRSARERIDKLWPPHEKKRRCVMPDCKGRDDKPRVLVSSDGKVCRACRQREKRRRDKEEAERRDQVGTKRGNRRHRKDEAA